MIFLFISPFFFQFTYKILGLWRACPTKVVIVEWIWIGWVEYSWLSHIYLSGVAIAKMILRPITRFSNYSNESADPAKSWPSRSMISNPYNLQSHISSTFPDCGLSSLIIWTNRFGPWKFFSTIHLLCESSPFLYPL